jgi:hypothetical protein
MGEERRRVRRRRREESVSVQGETWDDSVCHTVRTWACASHRECMPRADGRVCLSLLCHHSEPRRDREGREGRERRGQRGQRAERAESPHPPSR